MNSVLKKSHAMQKKLDIFLSFMYPYGHLKNDLSDCIYNLY